MIWLTEPLVHLSPLPPFSLSLSSPFALAYPYSWFSPQPPSLLSTTLHHPHNYIPTALIRFFSLRSSSAVINSFHRSAVVVHRRRVPVHPPAGHRRHPHVHRGVSLWQCHRRAQAKRLRCHIHRAVRWVTLSVHLHEARTKCLLQI